MKKIDMRYRPPIPSIVRGGLYNENKEHFAPKFFGGMRDESAIKKDLDMAIADMEKHEIIGFIATRRWGREDANADAAKIITEMPERFIGSVGLDLHDIDAVMKDIDTYVVNGPFIGVNLEPGLPAPDHQDALMYIDDERIFPIYEKCQELNLPVSITFGGPLEQGGIDKDPMRVHKVLKTFPKMRLALPHAAWPMFGTMVGLVAAFPNLFIGMDSYLMLPGWRDYVDAANYLCQDQLMFGTSYPLCSVKFAIDFYEKAGFRPDIMHKIYYQNAERFLGLVDFDLERQPSIGELTKVL